MAEYPACNLNTTISYGGYMTQDYGQNDLPRYAPLEAIKGMEIVNSLLQLYFIEDDLFMRSQAHNISMVDKFLTKLEYDVLAELHRTEHTPPQTYFLAAQSQMWIFAAYELLRTWTQRTKDFIRLAQNGGLEQKLKALKSKKSDFLHVGLDMRIKQLESAIKNPTLVDELETQRLHMYIPFTRLEYIRVSMAKHEVSKKNNSIALSPVDGRINTWCGSLDYELENGKFSMGLISRRDIADSIRYLDIKQDPPSQETIKNFDEFMFSVPPDLPD